MQWNLHLSKDVTEGMKLTKLLLHSIQYVGRAIWVDSGNERSKGRVGSQEWSEVRREQGEWGMTGQG